MSKINRYVERLKKLIKDLEKLKNSQTKEYPGTAGWGHLDFSDEIDLKLQLDVKTILKNIFGENNDFLKKFNQIIKDEGLKEFNVESSLGLLKSALDNLENGYLEQINNIIKNEIFNNLLEEAKYFIYKKNHKDIGALLLRIVLENNIKRISKNNNIKIENTKTSNLNDELKKENFYSQTQWRQIQVWLDIGNEAHHGNFNKYKMEEVKNFYIGLEQFIINYFNN